MTTRSVVAACATNWAAHPKIVTQKPTTGAMVAFPWRRRYTFCRGAVIVDADNMRVARDISVPSPKFAVLCGGFSGEFRIRKDTKELRFWCGFGSEVLSDELAAR